jgi:hypothetical protein
MLDPARFSLSFSMAMAIPAAAFLFEIFSNRSWIAIFFGVWILWFQTTWLLADKQKIGSLQAIPLGEKNPVIQDLMALRSPGRVLWENVDGDRGMAGAYPWITKREFVGLVPSDTYLTFCQAAEFFSGPPPTLFGVGLNYYADSTLLSTLSRYDISTVVAFTSAARARFDQNPAAFAVDVSSDAYTIYHVNGYVPTRLYYGSGDVRATLDRIEIQNASAGRLVLKYHWLESLTAPLGVTLYPVYMPRDPIPFIGIENPTGLRRISIVNS